MTPVRVVFVLQVAWRWSRVSFGNTSTMRYVSMGSSSHSAVNLNPLNIDRGTEPSRITPRVVLWLAFSASLLLWDGRPQLVTPLQMLHAIQSIVRLCTQIWPECLSVVHKQAFVHFLFCISL